jgi:hypothetical protein
VHNTSTPPGFPLTLSLRQPIALTCITDHTATLLGMLYKRHYDLWKVGLNLQPHRCNYPKSRSVMSSHDFKWAVITEFNCMHFIKHSPVETVIVAHLVNIFLAIYENQLFFPMFTTARSTDALVSQLNGVSTITSNIFLTSTLFSYLCSDLSSDPSSACYIPYWSLCPRLVHPKNIWGRVQPQEFVWIQGLRPTPKSEDDSFLTATTLCV